MCQDFFPCQKIWRVGTSPIKSFKHVPLETESLEAVTKQYGDESHGKR